MCNTERERRGEKETPAPPNPPNHPPFESGAVWAPQADFLVALKAPVPSDHPTAGAPTLLAAALPKVWLDPHIPTLRLVAW